MTGIHLCKRRYDNTGNSTAKETEKLSERINKWELVNSFMSQKASHITATYSLL